MRVKIKDTELLLIQGDITEQDTDAIVSGESRLRQVVFCLYDSATLALFQKQLDLFRLPEA
jgi:O-acetyl-ADP-ribose deacetylase (regulator of RNase III)